MDLAELFSRTNRSWAMKKRTKTRDNFNIQIKETLTIRGLLRHQRKLKDTLPRLLLLQSEREKMWGSWTTRTMLPHLKQANRSERLQQLKKKLQTKWKGANLCSLIRRGGCQIPHSRLISESQRSMHMEREMWTQLSVESTTAKTALLTISTLSVVTIRRHTSRCMTRP